MLVIDEKYNPASILTPIVSNSRHSLVVRDQIELSSEKALEIWKSITKRKIENQAATLSMLGLEGFGEVARYAVEVSGCNEKTIDVIEAMAAKAYFGYLHPGLNRRIEEPMNSRLNYGYAVIRNAIIRSLIVAGFHPAIGIHHKNRFNSFNLADDLIEPWRPWVDILAYMKLDSNLVLNAAQRKELAGVLHNACKIGGSKCSVILGIDTMVASFKNMIVRDTESELELPTVMPVERIEVIME